MVSVGFIAAADIVNRIQGLWGDDRDHQYSAEIYAAYDMDERRIFDRILECCMPVQFDCQNFRQINRQENMKKAIRLLNGD